MGDGCQRSADVAALPADEKCPTTLIHESLVSSTFLSLLLTTTAVCSFVRINMAVNLNESGVQSASPVTVSLRDLQSGK